VTEKQSRLFPDSRTPGPLIDSEIEDGVSAGYLITRDTFASPCLEASSYDVRVGAKGLLGGVGRELDLREEPLELGPGAYGGVISLERLRLPDDVCARIGSKRALSYDGVILLTGTLVDPGYEGHLLFGLYNASHRRVLIRSERKLCNVVFERLARPPNKRAPIDPNLRIGSFPDAFVDRMANMEVLPWMQISERVKQIEQITKDILDLKARYDDVLQPIRDLTTSVSALTQDVSTLTAETRGIAEDVSENTKQITQLTANLGVLTGAVQGIQDRSRALEDSDRGHAEAVTGLRTSFGRLQLVAWMFWGLVLLGMGALLPTLFERLLNSPSAPAANPGGPKQ